MTGSAVDGEDVLQDTFLKAFEALPRAGKIANPTGWVFRIAHNAALDFLRRRGRYSAIHADEDLESVADPITMTDSRDIAATSFHAFTRLPLAERSSVILMDVLGYSLQEIGGMLGSTVPAVKASLHRGRARLHAIANEPADVAPPMMEQSERRRLAAYIEHFNARDFDAIRNLLAEEVRLDLVSKTRMNGRREVGNYLHNYAGIDDWHLRAGWADRRAAVLVIDPRDSSRRFSYFILLKWNGESVSEIRDFRHARYAIDGAELIEAA
jgi:RNA polymerase sigma-70 factor (ECF subfamily)